MTESLNQNIDLIINLKDNVKNSTNESMRAIDVYLGKIKSLEERWGEIAKKRDRDSNQERRLIKNQVDMLNRRIQSEKVLQDTISQTHKLMLNDVSSISVDRAIRANNKVATITKANIQSQLDDTEKLAAFGASMNAQMVKDATTSYKEKRKIEKAEDARFISDKEKLAAFGASMNKTYLAQELSDYKKARAEKIKADNEAQRARSKTAEGAWSGGTTFGHKFVTTSQYMAAGMLIGGGVAAATTAASTLVQVTAEADLSARTMAAVLDLSVGKAKELEGSVRKLGETFGGSLSDIDGVALALGRAGVSMKDIIPATEVVLSMARLTGDTFEQSTNAIISFQQVYGNTTSIESLGNKLAYVANVSRLSTQDIGTFSNYALAAAKSVGITEDAVGGLAAAFSNAGVNASTIGTQIRRFTTLLTDDSEAVTNFFDSLGVSQKALMISLQQGGKESNEALLQFVNTLARVDKTTFNNLTGQMDILAANVLQLMRNNTNNINQFVGDLQTGVSGQLENTKVILESYMVTYESIYNTLYNKLQKYGDKVAENARYALTSLEKDYLTVASDIFKDEDATKRLSIIKQADKLKQITRDIEETDSTTLSGKQKLLKLAEDEKQVKTEIANIAKEQLKEIDTKLQTREDLLKTASTTSYREDLKSEIQTLKAEQSKLKALANVSKSKSLEETYKDNVQQLEEWSKVTTDANKDAIEKLTKTIKADVKHYEESIDKASGSVQVSVNKNLDDYSAKVKAMIGANKDVTAEMQQFNTFIDQEQKRTKESIEKSIKNNKAILGDAMTQELSGTDWGKSTKVNELRAKLVGATTVEAKKQAAVLEDILRQENNISVLETKRTNLQNSLNTHLKSGATTAQAETDKKQKLMDREEQAKAKIVEYEKILLGEETLTLGKAQEKFNINTQLLALAYQNYELAKGTNNEGKRSAEYQEAIAKYYESSVKYIEKAKDLEQKRAILNEEVESGLKSAIQSEEVRLGIIEKAVDSEYEKLRLKIAQAKIDDPDNPNIAKYEEDLRKLDSLKNKKKDIHTLDMEYRRELNEMDSVGYTAARAGLQSLESGMMEFFDRSSDGWLNWHTLASNILSDIYKQLLQQLVVKQIVSGIAGGISGYFGTPTIAKADGGMIPTKGYVNGGVLSGGTGIRDDIYLGNVGGTRVFAMGGEFITRKSSVNENTRGTLDYINQTGSVPNTGSQVNVPVSINVENQTGQNISADMVSQMTKQNSNGEYEKVVSIVLKAAQVDPRVRSILKGK